MEAKMVALLLLNGTGRPEAIAATVLIRLATLWFAVGLGIIALSLPERARKASGLFVLRIDSLAPTSGGNEVVSTSKLPLRIKIVIVALGANDGLRGYRTADIEVNLDEIIRQAKRSRAKVLPE